MRDMHVSMLIILLCLTVIPLSSQSPWASPSGSFVLYSLWPNPLHADKLLQISARVDQREISTLGIYNTRGQLLHSRQLYQGDVKLELSMNGYPAGIYFCRLKSGASEQIRKFVLLK